MSKLIAVVMPERNPNQIDAYRYGNVKDTGRREKTERMGRTVAFWEAEDERAATNQRDRLSSGLIGSHLIESEADIPAFLQDL